MAQDDTMAKIQASARIFDLNNDPNNEAEQYLDAVAGDQDVTNAADAQELDVMPFDAAVKIVTMAQDETFQFFCEIQELLHARFTVEAKNFKATQDSRTLYGNLAMGIEQVQIAWGERIAEATARVQAATSEEKRKVNVSVKRVLDAMPAPTTEGPTKAFQAPGDGHYVDTLPGMRVAAIRPA